MNILDLNLAELTATLKGLGEPAYRAQQIMQWIHQRGVDDFNAMTNLSKSLRTYLLENATIKLPDIALEQAARDGTHKWLLRLADGNAIETVFIPDRGRGTLCVSSQVGCALNCSFCSTGKEGFNRNLKLSEIIGQLWIAEQRLKPLFPDKNKIVTNVVMMGMGEPLLNYQPVLNALTLMTSDYAYGLSKYRVTVSTSGVVPAMLKLREDSEVALAVSLHAPNDALRNQLVPLNKKYPLKELMAVCKRYFPAGSKRQVTFEYVMLKDVNDKLEHAKQLIQLLKNIPAKMNLIPFNPFPKTNYETSDEAVILRFQKALVDAGISTYIRRTRGDDIDAACGQLAGQIQDRTGRHLRWKKTGRLIPIVAE